MTVGERTLLGLNNRLQGTRIIGVDCVMGPDAVMIVTSYEYKDLERRVGVHAQSNY